jgi:hypothetical protein
LRCSYSQVNQALSKGHSEPAPTSSPSTGCLLWLSCGWSSTELLFGFILVTHSINSRSNI